LNVLSFIQAQARKEELRKQPEKVILSEVRQVVQQMQALNQHLEEAVSLHLKI
jgi:DNA anti-recombination protein RmuC